MFRDIVAGRVAEWPLPDWRKQTRRAASAVVRALADRVKRRQRPIRVTDVSPEWLAGHAVDSDKHLEDA